MMSNSVSSLGHSAESLSKDSWEEFFRLPRVKQASRLQAIRDPIQNTLYVEGIVSVFGFYEDKAGTSFVYFWHKDSKSVRWSTIGNVPQVDQAISLGEILLTQKDNQPHLRNVISLVGEKKFYSICDCQGSTFANLETTWKKFGNCHFVALHEKQRLPNSEDDKTSVFDERYFVNALAFHYDLFTFRSPIWNAAPMRFLFENKLNNKQSTRALHLHPRCFNPKSRSPEMAFLWPWQYCLEEHGEQLKYKSIDTVSLSFDLRKSTISMEQLSDKSIFSNFIMDVVRVAKEIVFEYGGYFDKETGDGLIAHFVDFPSDFITCNSAVERSFAAGEKIIIEIEKLCDAFQKKLKYRISNLGASIGLHKDKAVWICSHNNVHAVGQSVIDAVRLCNEAPVRGTFVTNSFLDLSRFSAAPSSQLSGYTFESQGAFPA